MHFAYRNVNHAMLSLPSMIASEGSKTQTRNGLAYTLDEPIIIEIVRPCERTHMVPERKANTLLFLLDGLSILSDRDWVTPFSDIVPRFKKYSDDGVHLRGHYGKRIAPQLLRCISMLRTDPSSRRNVLQIWDASLDHGTNSVDIPCNVMVTLKTRGDFLDLHVFNRSNDVWWGLLGANIVQFSFLLEYLALMSNLKVGRLYQISTNAHVYLDFGPGDAGTDWTLLPQPEPTPLDVTDLSSELNFLFDTLAYQNGWERLYPSLFQNMFIRNVVVPMLQAHYTNEPAILRAYPNNDWFMSMRIGKGWGL